MFTLFLDLYSTVELLSPAQSSYIELTEATGFSAGAATFPISTSKSSSTLHFYAFSGHASTAKWTFPWLSTFIWTWTPRVTYANLHKSDNSQQQMYSVLGIVVNVLYVFTQLHSQYSLCPPRAHVSPLFKKLSSGTPHQRHHICPNRQLPFTCKIKKTLSNRIWEPREKICHGKEDMQTVV